MSTDPNQEDWVERLTRLAGRLGLNPIRVRWKLERWRQRTTDRLALGRRQVQHVGFAHAVCRRCGRVQEREAQVCSGCGERLGNRAMQLLGRLGARLPVAWSASTAMGLVLLLVYARVVAAVGVDELFSVSGETLIRFGGNFAPAVLAGEWWRLGTAALLHAGVWHLGFNVVALSQIGPAIEEVYGRARLPLLLLATAVAGNAVSLLAGLDGVGIGASGGIMGLVGLGAAWGHRQAGGRGVAVRNQMLQWLLYTMIFGYFLGADHAAHLGGFAAGAALGWLWTPRGAHSGLWVAASVAVWLVLAGLVVWAPGA